MHQGNPPDWTQQVNPYNSLVGIEWELYSLENPAHRQRIIFLVCLIRHVGGLYARPMQHIRCLDLIATINNVFNVPFVVKVSANNALVTQKREAARASRSSLNSAADEHRYALEEHCQELTKLLEGVPIGPIQTPH